MRRLGLTLMATVCLTADTFAARSQPTAAKWKDNINVNELGKYLNLFANQREGATNIYDYFNEQMSRAANSKRSQERLVRNAVYDNLRLMKKTLSKKQYTDYTEVLNVALQNKGIEVK